MTSEAKAAAERIDRINAGENSYQVYTPERFFGGIINGGNWTEADEQEFRRRQRTDWDALGNAAVAILNNPASFAGELADPIKWQQVGSAAFECYTRFGRYEAQPKHWWGPSDPIRSNRTDGDVEAAKAACLLDYHARVASVLRKAPNG